MTSSPSLPVLDFLKIGPSLGAPFPDIQLPDQMGRQVDLHIDRAGRPALVIFYRSARW